MARLPVTDGVDLIGVAVAPLLARLTPEGRVNLDAPITDFAKSIKSCIIISLFDENISLSDCFCLKKGARARPFACCWRKAARLAGRVAILTN